MRHLFCKCVLATALFASERAAAEESRPNAPGKDVLRVATYNVSMYRDRAGQLLQELETGESQQAMKIAEVLQRVRPHVVLLNEFDYMQGEPRLVTAFRELYLEKSQAGLEPIAFPYVFYKPVNTGVDSGMDLDNDGKLGDPADALGFGHYPGQYGMLVLSQLPIGAGSWTFQDLRWGEISNPLWPKDPQTGEHFYDEKKRRAMRLPSKSFWDVAVHLPNDPRTEGIKTLRLLCSHPTPPVFDGPEDANGCRNFDEIGMLARYITQRGKPLYSEDSGQGYTGLDAEDPFVVLGDLNADPVDGSGRPGAIQQLLDHPEIDSTFVPSSAGGAAASATSADHNGEQKGEQKGDPRHHTADFGADGYANLRVDYVLPSKGLQVVGGGVFWPTEGEPGAEAIKATDHRLVWLDLELAK